MAKPILSAFLLAALCCSLLAAARSQCDRAEMPAGALRQDIEEDSEMCLSALQVGKSKSQSQPTALNASLTVPLTLKAELDAWPTQQLIDYWIGADVDGNGNLTVAELTNYVVNSEVFNRKLPNATITVLGSRLANLSSVTIQEAGKILDQVYEIADSAMPSLMSTRASRKDQTATSPHLDKAVTRKAEDDRCVGVGEGQTCVSVAAYIYCSADHRLSEGETQCRDQMGMYSRCTGGGFGLTRDYCDDPFCRNGGASHGVGTYCKGDQVVYCASAGPDAPDAPRVVDTCRDEHWDQNDCSYTRRVECRDHAGVARCEDLGTDRQCGD